MAVRSLPTGMAPCVGSACRIWSDKDQIITRTRFATTQTGEDHWQASRDGHMRMFSVGFKDHKWEPAPNGAERLVEDTLPAYAAALRDWETAHPVTDEIRMKPGRDEEAPQIEIERTPDVPEPPPELMPPV